MKKIYVILLLFFPIPFKLSPEISLKVYMGTSEVKNAKIEVNVDHSAFGYRRTVNIDYQPEKATKIFPKYNFYFLFRVMGTSLMSIFPHSNTIFPSYSFRILSDGALPYIFFPDESAREHIKNGETIFLYLIRESSNIEMINGYYSFDQRQLFRGDKRISIDDYIHSFSEMK